MAATPPESTPTSTPPSSPPRPPLLASSVSSVSVVAGGVESIGELHVSMSSSREGDGRGKSYYATYSLPNVGGQHWIDSLAEIPGLSHVWHALRGYVHVYVSSSSSLANEFDHKPDSYKYACIGDSWFKLVFDHAHDTGTIPLLSSVHHGHGHPIMVAYRDDEKDMIHVRGQYHIWHCSRRMINNGPIIGAIHREFQVIPGFVDRCPIAISSSWEESEPSYHFDLCSIGTIVVLVKLHNILTYVALLHHNNVPVHGDLKELYARVCTHIPAQQWVVPQSLRVLLSNGQVPLKVDRLCIALPTEITRSSSASLSSSVASVTPAVVSVVNDEDTKLIDRYYSVIQLANGRKFVSRTPMDVANDDTFMTHRTNCFGKHGRLIPRDPRIHQLSLHYIPSQEHKMMKAIAAWCSNSSLVGVSLLVTTKRPQIKADDCSWSATESKLKPLQPMAGQPLRSSDGLHMTGVMRQSITLSFAGWVQSTDSTKIYILGTTHGIMANYWLGSASKGFWFMGEPIRSVVDYPTGIDAAIWLWPHPFTPPCPPVPQMIPSKDIPLYTILTVEHRGNVDQASYQGRRDDTLEWVDDKDNDCYMEKPSDQRINFFGMHHPQDEGEPVAFRGGSSGALISLEHNGVTRSVGLVSGCFISDPGTAAGVYFEVLFPAFGICAPTATTITRLQSHHRPDVAAGSYFAPPPTTPAAAATTVTSPAIIVGVSSS